MAQLLIRDVPEHVLTALDQRAARLGLSRSEFLRRRLAQEAGLDRHPVDAADLLAFADTFADLADGEVMARAWE